LCRIFALALVLTVPASGGDGAGAAANPFEPTVTQEEADLLQEAVDLRETDAEGAIVLLEAYGDEDRSPAIDFALGNFRYQAGRLEKAAEAYRAAIAKLPLFRGALNNLGRVYLVQENLPGAVATFQSLVRDGQGDADTLLLLGHALLLQGRPVAAEGAYRQSLTLRADGPEATRGLLKCLIEQDRNREVLALAREQIAREPGDAALWSLRANAHLALGEIAAAVTSIEAARRLGLAEGGLLATLGDVYLNRQQPRDAVAAYEDAFAVESPSVDRMLRAAEGLLLSGDLDASARFLGQAKTGEGMTSRQRRRHFRLGARLAQARGERDTARRQYEALAREDPLDAEALLALADMDRDDGDEGRAALLYERAARIEGSEARALLRHGQLEVDRGRYREAIVLLESAQAFDPRPHVARYLEQVRRLAKQ